MSIQEFKDFQVVESRKKKYPTNKDINRAAALIVSKINQIAPKAWTVTQSSTVEVINNPPQNEILIMGIYTLSIHADQTINRISLTSKTHRQINKIIVSEFMNVGIDMSSAKIKNNETTGYIGVSIFNDISNVNESITEAKETSRTYTKKDLDSDLKKFYKATGLQKSAVKSTFQQNGDVVAVELEFSKEAAASVSRKIVAGVFDKKGDRLPAQFIIGKKVANVLKFVYVED